MNKPANYPAVTVLICTLNEAQNLHVVLPKIPDWVEEIIIIDGHSTDATIEMAKKLCPRAKIIAQTRKGKGNALKEGVRFSANDMIVTLDADGSTDPTDLPKYIESLLNGYDLVKGSRFLRTNPKMPFHHKLGNRVLVITTNLLFGAKYTDVCSGYNAFHKNAFLKLNLKNDGFEMEQEMVAKAKKNRLKVIEIQQIDKGRIGSFSKVSSFKQGFKDLWIIIKERF